ncbi:MAG: YoaK family protein [Bacteroidota bacterium]
MLSLAAGFVNAAGFLAFAVLTTNVTGHAALFAERLVMGDWKTARVVGLWMLLFLAGTFFSSLTINKIGINRRFSYIVPLITETLVLIIVAVLGYRFDQSLPARELFAGSLLFVMGMQNAMVSLVSGSRVRTTHLTGTFTDLGIELAQWFCFGDSEKRELIPKLKLSITIIGCFLFGALAGAWFFRHWHYHAFLFPSFVLLFTLTYDIFRIRAKRFYGRTTVRLFKK